jgi:hypothetical protein
MEFFSSLFSPWGDEVLGYSGGVCRGSPKAKRLVRRIVRMEIGHKILDAAYLDQLAPARGLHGFHSFSAGSQRVEGKCSFGHGPHQHHADGVGDVRPAAA